MGAKKKKGGGKKKDKGGDEVSHVSGAISMLAVSPRA
jgi:hypothetical protein